VPEVPRRLRTADRSRPRHAVGPGDANHHAPYVVAWQWHHMRIREYASQVGCGQQQLPGEGIDDP
jgi:hypothetical protein